MIRTVHGLSGHRPAACSRDQANLDAAASDPTSSYRLRTSPATLSRITRELKQSRLARTPADGWRYGMPRPFLRELVRYWRGGYDWRASQRRLNRYHQFQVTIDGQRMHFIRERGSRARRALLMLHGWPYSPFKMGKLIERLAYPERFGGRAEDGFDVIAPSLPGHAVANAQMRDQPSEHRRVQQRGAQLRQGQSAFSLAPTNGDKHQTTATNTKRWILRR